MKRIIQGTIFLLLLVLGSGALAAQQRIVQGEITPLSSSDPRARRATELFEPLLRGDPAAAEAYLKQHASPEYGRDEEGATFASVAEQFAGSGYTVDEVLGGMENDVILQLRKGDGRRAVMIAIERAEPHRILGFPSARIRIQSGGPRQ